MERILSICALLLLSVPVPSQNPPSAVGEKFKCQAPSPAILVVVETTSPLPPSNTDLLVSVDKQPFAPVSKLVSASSASLDFILVVDSSSSAVRSELRTTALDEISRFLNALRDNKISVRTAVVEFNSESRLVQDFTNDPIENSLKRLSSGGGSALYDSLALAARLAQQAPASDRRIILVVSDGEDNLSNTTPKEVVQAAIRASAPIYALSVGEPPAQYAPFSGRGERFLREVSAQTGGKAYFPKKPVQVAEMLDAIRSEMQTQYFATVTIPTKKGFHNVRFKSSKPQESVRGATAIACE